MRDPKRPGPTWHRRTGARLLRLFGSALPLPGLFVAALGLSADASLGAEQLERHPVPESVGEGEAERETSSSSPHSLLLLGRVGEWQRLRLEKMKHLEPPRLKRLERLLVRLEKTGQKSFLKWLRASSLKRPWKAC
jgi:hypothetical protein